MNPCMLVLNLLDSDLKFYISLNICIQLHKGLHDYRLYSMVVGPIACFEVNLYGNKSTAYKNRTFPSIVLVHGFMVDI